MNNGELTISNLEELLKKSLERLENLSDMCVGSNLEVKRRMHKTLFLEGIFYDPKNHQYLTRNMNRYVELVSSISTTCVDKKTGPLNQMIKSPVLYRRADLNCRPSGYESDALTS